MHDSGLICDVGCTSIEIFQCGNGEAQVDRGEVGLDRSSGSGDGGDQGRGVQDDPFGGCDEAAGGV